MAEQTSRRPAQDADSVQSAEPVKNADPVKNARPAKKAAPPQKKRPAGTVAAKKAARPGPDPAKKDARPAKRGEAHKSAPGKKGMTEKERSGAQLFGAILFLSLVFYLVIVLIIAMLVWYSFSYVGNNASQYGIKAVNGEEETLFSRTAREANNDYGLYLRYSDLSGCCGIGVAGDEEEVTFLLPGGNNSILCFRNSSLAYLNGITVRLSEPVLFEGNDFLLPVSLFETYLDGLTITYDEDKLLCTVLIPDPPVFTLRMQKPDPMDPCESFPGWETSSGSGEESGEESEESSG